MKTPIVNTSRLSVKQIRPLVGFVSKYFFHSNRAYIVVQDHEEAGVMCGGEITYDASFLRRRDLGIEDFDRYSEIVLDISRDIVYPIGTKHRKTTRWVQLNSIEEEIVLVLAHEMRHLDQWHQNRRVKIANPEVDAERHAIMVLNEYREELKEQPAPDLSKTFGEYAPRE